MPRFIDDIRAAGKFGMPWFVPSHLQQTWAEYAGRITDLVYNPDLAIVLIDNVADFYYRTSDQERWDYNRDFPNVAPPFQSMWMEHRMPTVIHSREFGDTDVAASVPRGRVGMLFTALDAKDCNGEGIPEACRWILWADLFLDNCQGGNFLGPVGATFFAVDEQGAILGLPWSQTASDPRHGEVMKSYITFFQPALLAICFLHCKNVQIRDESVDKPLAKKYHAKTGSWPTKYKTLIIEPLKEILRTQGRSGEVGIRKAIHICRGHFADYTEGRGLFGKYHGRFWIPSTVRGTKRGAEKPPAREIEIKV